MRADTAPNTPQFSTAPAGIAFVPRTREFAFQHLLSSFSALNVSFGLYGQRLQYPAAAASTLYGTGCGAGVISATRPFAGDEFFAVSMTGRPNGTACVFFLGFGPAAVPLDLFAMTGCVFNLDPSLLAFNVATTVSGGAARLGLPLPDDPVFLGDLYAQWAFVQPGLNGANLAATRGVRIQVR